MPRVACWSRVVAAGRAMMCVEVDELHVAVTESARLLC